MYARSLRIIACCLGACFWGAAGVAAQEDDWLSQWEEVFSENAMEGTFVLRLSSATAPLVVNEARARRRFRPASTFKIANAAIALEIGAVRDLEEILPYQPVQKLWLRSLGGAEYFDSWERDMNLKEAMRRSNVAVFHQIARRGGLARYRSRLRAWEYGNGDPGESIDQRFWLTGPLEVTALEQAEFLSRLGRRELGLGATTGDLLRETLLLERVGASSLYAKTGWVGPDDPQIGGSVGWIEGPEGVTSFALNIDSEENEDAKLRVPMGRTFLEVAGAWPPSD